MNEDSEFGYKLRQVLNHGTENLPPNLSVRLHQARQDALDGQRSYVSTRALTAGGISMESRFFSQSRGILAAVALSIGVIGTYYWNSFEHTSELEEIDSALLADELPPSIYLDRGFQAWLDHDSNSFSSSP